MLRIKEKLRPFSHLPGSRCWVPGTRIEVQAFPTKLIVNGKEYPLPGPVEQFTLMQDFERHAVIVFSERYRLYVWPNGSVRKERPPIVLQERLFLGCTKKSDWEMVKRRMDMREIFPIWFQLGQMTQASGSFSLLDECRAARADPREIIPAFTKLFRVAFSSMMVPRRTDEDCLGLTSDEVKGELACLLTEGAALIRSLFLEGNQLLPHLPPEFHCGKLLTPTLDMEWRSKQIRRVWVRSAEEPHLILPKKITQYRVTKKGEKLYFLDRFKK